MEPSTKITLSRNFGTEQFALTVDGISIADLGSEKTIKIIDGLHSAVDYAYLRTVERVDKELEFQGQRAEAREKFLREQQEAKIATQKAEKQARKEQYKNGK